MPPILPPALPVIVIPHAAAAADAARCPDYAAPAIAAAGGQIRRPDPGAKPADALRGAGGLFIPDAAVSDSAAGGSPVAVSDSAAGGSPDAAVAVSDSAGGSSPVALDLAPLLEAALDIDLPVLLTGGAMHLLNAVFGGQPAPPAADHYCADGERHQIYLSPGSKVAAIIGAAGMFRVNSRHRLGLREPQRAARLMSIAYQLDDGVIEGLESRQHGWVIAVQFLPERREEAPALFNNLFLGLVERAADFSAAADARRPA